MIGNVADRLYGDIHWSAALGASPASPDWRSGAAMSLLAARSRIPFGQKLDAFGDLIVERQQILKLRFAFVPILVIGSILCRGQSMSLVPYFELMVLRCVSFPFSMMPASCPVVPT